MATKVAAFIKDKLLLVFRPAVSASLLLSGGYVWYKDYSRYPRMIRTYERGSILPPFRENDFEIRYAPREREESKLGEILKSEFTNKYYLVNGEVGSGKSRILIHMTRELVKTKGKDGEGAPIYVCGTQGKALADTLAEAVNYRFDEHISFTAFLDYALQIRSFPKKDDHNKLLRVLDAIEESAFLYSKKHGRPVVLILDNAGKLEQQLPNSMKKLQEKAKLWADTNTVKVIFVTAEDSTEFVLQSSHSNWSRAATPITVGDLTQEEAVGFLTSPGLLECDTHLSPRAAVMTPEIAREIHTTVGGKILHLMSFKFDYQKGLSIEDTLNCLKEKEREKLLQVAGHPKQWQAIKLIKDAPGMRKEVSGLLREVDKEDLLELSKAHVLKVERTNRGIFVGFESELTKNVIVELYKAHDMK